MRVRRILSLAVLVVAWTLPPATARPEPDAAARTRDLYVRDLATPAAVLERIAAEASHAGVREVTVVFDRITFAPPPGRNEYRADHDYPGDLGRWLDATAAWAAKGGVAIRVAPSAGAEAIPVGAARWRETLADDLAAAWWDEKGRFEPAARLLARLAPRGSADAPALVVLLASEWTPERYVDGDGEAWRDLLLPVGTYFDPERVAEALRARGARLVVVAPEVRFGDEVPLPTLPLLPWAARPMRPPPDAFGHYGADPGAAYERLLREEADRELQKEYPDPVERKRRLDELLGPSPDDEKTAPGGAPPGGKPTPPASGLRFTSGTPGTLPRYGGQVVFASDVPSGFGWWPYARAALETGGRYVFYPFPAAPWLDVCPRDDTALLRLAPSLAPEDGAAARIAADPVAAALLVAADHVARETPWTYGAEAGSGPWGAWKPLARPPRVATGYRPRRVPLDPYLLGSAEGLRAEAKRLAHAAHAYDEAVATVERVLARPGSAPARSLADARLARFWLEMSAFHLASLAASLAHLDTLVPPGSDLRHGRFSAAPLTAIRLSDCLDAYDGRTLPASLETTASRLLHRAWSPPGVPEAARWPAGDVVPGQQGNLLALDPRRPEYRGQRDLDAVLRYLDPALRPRALRMIEAAKDVMAHDARTPWGWTVYYSEAKCWIFDPVDGGPDGRPRAGDDDESSPPWSPTPRGGSTPGGPVTPR